MGAAASLDLVFSAFADPTRRAIVARLAAGEATVGELVEPFALSQPAISKHLKVLERAGLVSRGRSATFRPVRLEAAPLAEADHWIGQYRQFWDASFDRLAAHLETMKYAEESHHGRRHAPDPAGSHDT